MGCNLRMRKCPVLSSVETRASSVGGLGMAWLRRRGTGRKSILGRGNEKPQGWQRRRQLGAQGIGHREERWAQCWAELLRLHEDSGGLRFKLILSGIP